MKTTRCLGLVTILAGFALAGSAAGAEPAIGRDFRIRVDFVEADNFTDVRDRMSGGSPQYRDAVLGELREFLQRRGAAMLHEDLTLEIRVTNVDLAGDFDPMMGPSFDQIRVVKEIYPTRITLEFRLSDTEGNVLASGTRQLSDFGHRSMHLQIFASDPLRYEKDVLRRWLTSEFRKFRQT